MNKKLLVLLLIFSLTLAACQKVEKEENEDNNDNNGAISVQPIDNSESMSESEENEDNTSTEEEDTIKTEIKPIVVAPKPEIDPKLCEIDMDCVAIPHPSNGCYKGYFNKNATEAIEAYRSQDGMMVQDCPDMGAPVCVNNKCVEKK